MSKKFLLYLTFYIAILLFVFRNIILHISTNLLDWRDYATYIWVIFQNLTHITNLDFINFFETTSFYPNKLTLLFLDTLLPQSIIFLPFYYLTSNLILAFNLTFLITFVLNFVSLFLFWKQLFKKELLAFFGSLFVIFSPFLHSQLGYFTVLSYWPFFFGLYFLFKKNAKRNLLFTGLFLSIQFLASIYIGIFMIVTIFVFFSSKYLFKNSGIKVSQLIWNLILIFIVFTAISGIFIKGYFDMKKIYNAKRDIKEYIGYSANLSDYFFTTKIDSILHKSLMDTWNKFDKNQGSHSSFPGFLIFFSAIFALFKIYRKNQKVSISLIINQEQLFFLSLIILGFLFSLGPRLNFNGNYAHIPLPYYVFLKFIPGTESLRGLVRWDFLFYLGFTYFSLLTLRKLVGIKSYKYYFILIFILFVVEYIPINIKSSNLSYLTGDHQTLKQICNQEKKVLLELPVTHLNAGTNIREGLQYMSAQVQLASTYHGCYLINGYSGYDLPENFILADILNKYIQDQNTDGFIKELRKRKVNLVKFNQKYFTKELKSDVNIFLENIATESGVRKVGSDLFSIEI